MAEKIQHLAGTSTHMAAPNHPLRRPPGCHRAPLPPARTLVGQPGSAGHVRDRGVHQTVAPVLNRAELIQPCVATTVAAREIAGALPNTAVYHDSVSGTLACDGARHVACATRVACRLNRAEYSALRPRPLLPQDRRRTREPSTTTTKTSFRTTGPGVRGSGFFSFTLGLLFSFPLSLLPLLFLFQLSLWVNILHSVHWRPDRRRGGEGGGDRRPGGAGRVGKVRNLLVSLFFVSFFVFAPFLFTARPRFFGRCPLGFARSGSLHGRRAT